MAGRMGFAAEARPAALFLQVDTIFALENTHFPFRDGPSGYYFYPYPNLE